MAIDHLLREHLEPGTELEFYGTGLTPEAFEYFEHDGLRGWKTVCADRYGTEREFGIWLNLELLEELGCDTSSTREPFWFCSSRQPGSAQSFLDAPPLQHPWDKTIGMHAPLSLWFEAIGMQASAWALARNNNQLWAGQTLEDSLVRAEHSITFYDSHEAAVRSFESIAQLQQWLDTALEHTQVSLAARQLADYPYEPGASRDAQFLQTWSSGSAPVFFPLPVATNLDPETWFSSTETQQGPQPCVEVRRSGSQLMGFDAQQCLDWDKLRGEAVLLEAAELYLEDFPWIILHVTGTNAALAFPYGVSNIVIDTDLDGAFVSVRIEPSAARSVHLRRRAAFERRWAHWLDDSHALSGEALAAGIAAAEAGLQAVLDQEED